MITLTADQQRRLAAATETAVADCLENLPRQVESIITSAIANLCGLQRDSHGWRLANSTGILGTILEGKCRDEVGRLFMPLLNRLLPQVFDQLQQDQQFLRDLASQLRYLLDHRLTNLVDRQIREYVEAQGRAIVSGLEKVDLTAIFGASFEEADPASYNTRVGQIVLEEITRQRCQGRKLRIAEEYDDQGLRHVFVEEDK